MVIHPAPVQLGWAFRVATPLGNVNPRYASALPAMVSSDCGRAMAVPRSSDEGKQSEGNRKASARQLRRAAGQGATCAETGRVWTGTGGVAEYSARRWHNGLRSQGDSREPPTPTIRHTVPMTGQSDPINVRWKVEPHTVAGWQAPRSVCAAGAQASVSLHNRIVCAQICGLVRVQAESSNGAQSRVRTTRRGCDARQWFFVEQAFVNFPESEEMLLLLRACPTVRG
jgi:hypothetical protein